MNKKVDIYTDGACSGNPGPGGWGVLIQLDDKNIELSGGDNETTNNRMELMAAIKALEEINKDYKTKNGKKGIASSHRFLEASGWISQRFWRAFRGPLRALEWP